MVGGSHYAGRRIEKRSNRFTRHLPRLECQPKSHLQDAGALLFRALRAGDRPESRGLQFHVRHTQIRVVERIGGRCLKPQSGFLGQGERLPHPEIPVDCARRGEQARA